MEFSEPGFEVTPPNCSDWSPFTRYEKVVGDDVIGAGSYGIVHKVRCRETGMEFALKRFKFQNPLEGVSSTTIREVGTLRELTHPNIVQLYDVFCSADMISLVLELLDCDLKKFLNSKHMPAMSKSTSMVQDLMYQLFSGVGYCHRNYFLHRDLKPENLLIQLGNAKNGGKHTLQIADFGLARVFGQPSSRLTHKVVTMWYRAPEILMGYEMYCIGVDMWSIGCILAEFCIRAPLFLGDCEIGTMFKIFQLCGTPDDTNWPGVTKTEMWSPNFPKWTKVAWERNRRMKQVLGSKGCNMLDNLLTYEPSKRLSCRCCLSHGFLCEVAEMECVASENVTKRQVNPATPKKKYR